MTEIDKVVASVIEKTKLDWYQYKVEFRFVGQTSRTRYFWKTSKHAEWETTYIRAFDVIEMLKQVYDNRSTSWNKIEITIDNDESYTTEYASADDLI